MNRNVLASITLTITALGLAAGMNGCSAAPGDAAVGTTEQAMTLESAAAGSSSGSSTTSTCTTPFTTPNEACFLSDGRLICSGVKCAAVTDIPTPSNTWTGSLPIPTPIAPPPALAALGCTWGVESLFVGDGNIWACPASVSAQIPGYLGTLTCTKYRYVGEPPCEIVTKGSTISPNPIVGNPHPGWILVQESYYDAWATFTTVDGGAIGGSCSGGCPAVQGD